MPNNNTAGCTTNEWAAECVLWVYWSAQTFIDDDEDEDEEKEEQEEQEQEEQQEEQEKEEQQHQLGF